MPPSWHLLHTVRGRVVRQPQEWQFVKGFPKSIMNENISRPSLLTHVRGTGMGNSGRGEILGVETQMGTGKHKPSM